VRILVTGAGGQVGFELLRALAPLGAVHALDRAGCDLADGAALRATLDVLRPQVIVNAAAYTAVDRAETDEATATAVNATALRVIGEAARELGAPVLHFSTDYVFDGGLDRPYAETDAVDPQGAYGRTKLAGERELAAATPRHWVLRTSWVVGAHGGNFARTMLRLAAERDALNVVADQIGAPTSAALLADLSAHVLRRWQLGGDAGAAFGLYHVTAAGHTSWFDYARFVLAQARAAGHPLKAGPDDVRPIATSQYPTPARRPANSRLDTARFTQTFGLRLPPWQEGVSHVLRQIL
jgi:dTDP-4-dehydrorhamnose reductase